MATGTGTSVPPWRNRIVGEADEPPENLLANPRNWRVHPGRQRDAMRGSLSEVGWVQRVIVNTTTGHVIDGHLRVEEAISAGAPTVPVLYVELTPEEEAVVLATLDPLGAMAGTSDERLRALLAEVTVADDGLAALLSRLARDYGDAYTGAIAVPRYEPTGDPPPPPAKLYDDERTAKLLAALNEDHDLDVDTRAFLEQAAMRHTRFEYGAIAEFYASAPANVQRHMEASALVIVDVDDAIRNGYLSFVSAIDALVEEDDGGD